MLTERLEQYEASEQHRELLASTQAEIAMHDTNFDDVLSQLSEQKHSIQQHLDQAQQELRSQLADARDREQSSSSVPSSSAEGEGEAGQSVLALQLRMQASSSSAASDANNGADTQVNEGEDAHTRTRTRTHAPNQALTQKLSDVLDTVSLLEKALMVRVHSHMEERADYEQALLEQQLAMTQQREVFESRMREQQNEYEEVGVRN